VRAHRRPPSSEEEGRGHVLRAVLVSRGVCTVLNSDGASRRNVGCLSHTQQRQRPPQPPVCAPGAMHDAPHHTTPLHTVWPSSFTADLFHNIILMAPLYHSAYNNTTTCPFACPASSCHRSLLHMSCFLLPPLLIAHTLRLWPLQAATAAATTTAAAASTTTAAAAAAAGIR
jgi:hypothetical protein